MHVQNPKSSFRNFLYNYGYYFCWFSLWRLFSRDWLVSYTGGEVKRFEGLDPDKFCFFELCDI